jgi:hypothetical protein
MNARVLITHPDLPPLEAADFPPLPDFGVSMPSEVTLLTMTDDELGEIWVHQEDLLEAGRITSQEYARRDRIFRVANMVRDTNRRVDRVKQELKWARQQLTRALTEGSE